MPVLFAVNDKPVFGHIFGLNAYYVRAYGIQRVYVKIQIILIRDFRYLLILRYDAHA